MPCAKDHMDSQPSAQVPASRGPSIISMYAINKVGDHLGEYGLFLGVGGILQFSTVLVIVTSGGTVLATI